MAYIKSGINKLSGKTLYVGNPADGITTILAPQASFSPGLRFHTDGYWQHSPDGTNWYSFPAASFSAADPGPDGYALIWNSTTNQWEAKTHNDLIGLQGGTGGEYYHFTNAQHTWLTNAYANGAWTVADGGTNITSYTIGDMLYASASDTLSTLGIGATGSLLNVSGGVPAWLAPGSSGAILQIIAGVPTWTATSASDVVSVVSCGTAGPITAATDGYLLPLFAESTDEQMSVFVAPIASTLSNLLVSAGTAPGGSDTLQVVVHVNGSATTCTATLTGADAYELDTNSTTLAAGDKVTVRFVTSATCAAADIMVNFQVTKLI